MTTVPGKRATRLAIVGAGDLGKHLAHHAQAVTRGGGLTVVGFFDDTMAPGTPVVGGGVVFGPLAAIETEFAAGRFDALLLGIGYRHFGLRRGLFERLRQTIPFASLVHPSCFVDETATIAPGAVLLPGCVVDKGAVVGENVLLNVGTIVAHDSIVGAHSFVGPGVVLAGFVRVGRSVFLGTGSRVIDNVTIADAVQTGAGAVVVKNLDEPGLYVGVPARWVRSHASNAD
jgi:sugar O-acyltransferase (sialic acid O-acetyltransferase NeuD family)